MKPLKRNSFIVGFVSALVLMTAVYAWNHNFLRGGVDANSPNGQYSLRVMGPLSPARGGAYDISLIEVKTLVVVRRCRISISQFEETVPLRGGGGEIAWDPESAYADVEIEGQRFLRIWVP
jgi:hypothetical protein